MKHYGTEDLHWEKEQVYLGKRKLCSVFPVGGILLPGGMMYKIRWPDGVESEDKYNLEWAKYHALTISLDIVREEQGLEQGAEPYVSPVDAFK
jgi:hypothetical protein